MVSSRSKHRENLKRNNCIELGNDVPTQQKTHEFSRKDLVINVGGGVVTDMGGFIASIFKRGMKFINIPIH